ncbi:unnamed protein product [Leptosia nina]|uniref:CLIP domain-containing serine protease n=1 Tax=Leptosia nina TaxID=320188 RepID=A0AAV1JGG0_9NEOP
MRDVRVYCVLLCSLAICAAKICKIPNGGAGECRPIEKCKPLYDLDNKPYKTEADETILHQSFCGNPFNPNIKVCCPPRSQWTNFRIKPVLFPDHTVISTPAISSNPDIDRTPYINKDPDINKIPVPGPAVLSIPDRNDPPDVIINYNQLSHQNEDNNVKEEISTSTCGIDTSSGNKIFGGEATNIDQYPWLVVLEYSGGLLLCGGSLITTKFIMTAAHCINGINRPPVFARLAEYNITSFPTDVVETDGGGEDSITVTIIPVEKTLVHHEHNLRLRTHDIGLVKLSRNAVLSDFIKIICLPTTDLLPQFNKKTNFTLAGWGSDETGGASDVKKHVMLPFVKEDHCKRIYADLPLLNVVCAGGEAGKDSCDGDSGGPLMYEVEQKYIAVGVLSFGYRQCGIADRPSVYTNVFKYVKWINDVVEGRIPMN